MKCILLLIMLLIAGCGGKLANYDVGVAAGHTVYDDRDVSPSSTFSVRTNFHFDM